MDFTFVRCGALNSHLSWWTRGRNSTYVSNTHWTPFELYYSTFKIYLNVYSIKYFVDPPEDIIKSLLNYNSDLCKHIWEAHKYLCYLPPEAQLNPSWTQFWPLAVVARWCNWGSNHYSGLTLLPDTTPRVSLDPKNFTLNLWDHSSPNPNRRIGLVWISCFLFWQDKTTSFTAK